MFQKYLKYTESTKQAKVPGCPTHGEVEAKLY